MRLATIGSSVRTRQVANWVNLSTPLGFALAAGGRARVRPGPNGLHLAQGYRWKFPTGSAFTIGDVVISRHDFEDLLRRRPGLLEHEEAHSRQWMLCLGLPFIPLYLASMGWSLLRTGDRAARCVFEQKADLPKGGYSEVPVRPIGPVLAGGVSRVRAAMARA